MSVDFSRVAFSQPIHRLPIYIKTMNRTFVTYEPINYNPYHDALLYGFLGDLTFVALIFAIGYFASVRGSKRNAEKESVKDDEKESENNSGFLAVVIVALFVPFLIIFSIISMKASWDNGQHLQDNVRQKYDIQGMVHVDRGFSETRTDQQRMEITSKGKTCFVWLVQNDKTSEPTLLDYDSKKPIEDLLKTHS